MFLLSSCGRWYECKCECNGQYQECGAYVWADSPRQAAKRAESGDRDYYSNAGKCCGNNKPTNCDCSF